MGQGPRVVLVDDVVGEEFPDAEVEPAEAALEDLGREHEAETLDLFLKWFFHFFFRFKFDFF